jgi:probable DNA metabolism protein
MGRYIYDGSFYGLMTTFAHIMNDNNSPTSIRPAGNELVDLFESATTINTDENIAEDLLSKIRHDISVLAYDHIIYAFLSEHPAREIILYFYIQKGLDVGDSIDAKLTDEWVLKTHSLTRKVEREVHRFKGFVRFSELADGSYYSIIEPDYHILPLLAPHFAQRLADQSWIIHDLKRHKAAIYNKKSVCVTKISLSEELLFADGDDEHKRLWQLYYKTIGIKERENPKLQQQFIPKKYQKHLVELGKS